MKIEARVVAVSADRSHNFSKPLCSSIVLLEGLGVEGDAHFGVTVQHRSRIAVDPTQPNLRQVHLMHSELFGELSSKGFPVRPGELGENITTKGIDLLALPLAARLHIGAQAVVTLTGLRNPCVQIDRFRRGLMAAVLDRSADGTLIRKSGVMGVVTQGGTVRPDDPIVVVLPDRPYQCLDRV